MNTIIRNESGAAAHTVDMVGRDGFRLGYRNPLRRFVTGILSARASTGTSSRGAAHRHWRNAVLAAVAGMFFLPLAGRAADWQQNTTVKGIAFDKVKVDDAGEVTGYLAKGSVIRERSCARDWIKIHANGELAKFQASQDIEVPRVRIPAGTWVTQNVNGVVTACAFPGDLEVQGHLCRGTGGSKGVQASFYESGALRQFFPVSETRIDGILCQAGLVRGLVELHENGRLKACRLAEDLKQGGQTFRKGTRIELDDTGKVLPKS